MYVYVYYMNIHNCMYLCLCRGVDNMYMYLVICVYVLAYIIS